ncbi:Uma2 family endonuclease [Geminisphaera colitermitum]|uniref:Uma2 family endonuclease n=1 Tax=Geminisphaera colitermitum TaxID=1148786 RepID=UPI0006941970|nr:Uma2 family endonuclease [Geminisphaera colitermitum]
MTATIAPDRSPATATASRRRHTVRRISRTFPILTSRQRNAAMPVGRPLLSSAQFLDWLQPGIHADLIGGQIFMHSPVSLKHAKIVNFLDSLLRQYIEEFELGELHRETVAVRLSPRDTFLPDLAYFTNEQATRLGDTHVDFAPTLVIEVLSPATARRNRELKFSAYEAHGVQEYWVIDPEKADHHFYRRAGDMFGEYATPEDGDARIDAMSIPGFWIRREWLADATRLPTVAPCLAELRTARKRRR